MVTAPDDRQPSSSNPSPTFSYVRLTDDLHSGSSTIARNIQTTTARAKRTG